MMDCITWKNTLKIWIKECSGSSNIQEQLIPPELNKHAELCPQCARLLEATRLLLNPLSEQKPCNKPSVQSHNNDSSLEIYYV